MKRTIPEQSTDLPTGAAALHPNNHGHLPSTNPRVRVAIPHSRTPLTGRNQTGYPLTRPGVEARSAESVYADTQRVVAEYFQELREAKGRRKGLAGCPGCDRGRCVDDFCDREYAPLMQAREGGK